MAGGRAFDSGSWYRKLYWIVVVEMVVVFALVLIWGQPGVDTISYFFAYDNLLDGRLDLFRTPVYPLLIGACRSLFGSLGGMFVVYVLQGLVFLYSLTRFRIIAETIIPNAKVAFLVTAIYGLAPGPMSLHFYLLTESLALSGMTILLYLVLAGVRGNLKAVCWSVPLLVGLLMLRPVFVYLPVALLLFWLAVAIKRKSKISVWIAGLMSAFVGWLTIGVYSWQMERQSGYRGLSVVALINTYLTVCDARLVDPEDATMPDIMFFMAEEYERKAEADRQVDTLDVAGTRYDYQVKPDEISEYYKAAFRNHPKETMEYFATKRLVRVCQSDAIYGGGSAVVLPIRVFTKYVSVNVGATYLLFILYVGILVWFVCHRKKFVGFECLLALLFVGCNAVVIVGGPNEWPRLLIPDIPVLLLIFGITLNVACGLLKDSGSMENV